MTRLLSNEEKALNDSGSTLMVDGEVLKGDG